LVVMDKGAGTITVYDSLGGEHPVIGASIKRWALDEADYYNTPARVWSVRHAWCRSQKNSDDCGVFTVQNMNYIAMGSKLRTMTRSTAYYRRRMAAELLARSIGGNG